MVTFYNTVIQDKLRKIEGFEKADITEGHLLCNSGDLVEQCPHKDYETTIRNLIGSFWCNDIDNTMFIIDINKWFVTFLLALFIVL